MPIENWIRPDRIEGAKNTFWGFGTTLRTAGKGCEPEWNVTFVFTVSDGATELFIKLLDSDDGTDDDFDGEAMIPLEAVYIEGSIPTTVYSVVKDEEYRGEIKVGLTFTPEDSRDQGF